MKEFVEYLAKHLVDKSEAVIVELEEKDDKTIFKLKVDQTDVGKLIGKKGRTASAMRVLLRAVAAKEGKKAVLDIIG
ncbi:MAG: KH domain-containing protein [Ignavibacteriales bacterium]|nr:KH domain-containing protein [Ignavibacteriales bacterium]